MAITACHCRMQLLYHRWRSIALTLRFSAIVAICGWTGFLMGQLFVLKFWSCCRYQGPHLEKKRILLPRSFPSLLSSICFGSLLSGNFGYDWFCFLLPVIARAFSKRSGNALLLRCHRFIWWGSWSLNRQVGSLPVQQYIKFFQLFFQRSWPALWWWQAQVSFIGQHLLSFNFLAEL